MNRMIDLSHWEDPNEVDYEKAKLAGVTQVYLKATQGLTYIDRTCIEHAKRAAAHGLPVGLYHFVTPTDDGNEQAKFFLDFVAKVEKEVKITLPLAIDVEPLTGTNVGWNKIDKNTRVVRLCNVIKTIEAGRSGERVIIYTGPSFWDTYFKNAQSIALAQGVDLSFRKLWIAHYGVSTPRVPAPWTTYKYWQWSESATTFGVKAGCDVSNIND